jgi:hypothetical protein
MESEEEINLLSLENEKTSSLQGIAGKMNCV